jgi:WhiB family redox-sensing transcriptional regulator
MRTSAEIEHIEPGVRTDVDSDWRHDAECLHYLGRVDFFPSRGESAREAKAVCAVCPVQRECLEYALRWDHLCGVWGGLSERERSQLRRERARR